MKLFPAEILILFRYRGKGENKQSNNIKTNKMSYIQIGDKIHKNPPEGGCNASPSSGKIIYEMPDRKDLCDRCFGLPR